VIRKKPQAKPLSAKTLTNVTLTVFAQMIGLPAVDLLSLF
jgi:hypothetical protein